MVNFYPIILSLHNILRWLIILSGSYVLFRSYRGWFKSRLWLEGDKKAGVYFTTALDAQFLLGLILYFALSPITKNFFSNFPEGMRSNTIRFFGVEHFLLMLIGIALAHYASSFSKKEITNISKFRNSAILYSIAFFVILIGIPWTTRPLLPF